MCISIRNSEIGKRIYSILPFMQRFHCGSKGRGSFMKKQLMVLICLALSALFVFDFALADSDWSHPYATLTSSPSITWMESGMLNHVIQMRESADGWFGFRTEANGNVVLHVLLDPQKNEPFNMNIYVNNQFYFSWAVPCDGRPASLMLGQFDAGTEIAWCDFDPDTQFTQTSDYLMLVETEKAPASTAAVYTPAPTEAVYTAAPTAAPVPDMVLNGSVKVGDRFEMGYYEQDNDLTNGREPIEWTVLDVNQKDDTALVIASEALECLQYHIKASGKLKWGNSSLRLWLNYCFFFDAFNPTERNCIEITSASSMADHVTLLDSNQISKYNLAKTGCDVTPYAISRGAEIGTDNGKGCWWVRMNTTGSQSLTMFVGIHGKVYEKNKVNIKNNAVRPAMTVSISALQNCPRLTDYRNRPMWNLAFTNQKIAARSGPTNNYDEVKTFDVPFGTPVNVLRTLTTGGTPWVEVEFLYQGEWLRVWTGKKRFEKVSTSGLPGDYKVIGSGVIASDTPGLYGPGNEYRTMYDNVSAGTDVDILSMENRWYLVQYRIPSSKLIMRTWVHADTVH